MRQLLLTLLLLAWVSSVAPAQIVGDMDDESKLYAQTKQVNQFFRRFNGEEDEKGERYYPADKQYRSVKLRRKYLGLLFDGSNSGITNDLKGAFTRDVLDKPGLLDFHGSNWFSEIHTTFSLNGKDIPVTLFMELEKDHLGYKWVIKQVHSQLFERYFSRDTTKVGKFLHPLSHELDFMNLRKAFESDSISQFTAKSFAPDHLSVFQIDGWYFELADFNRPGYNTGWLISSLVKLNGPTDKELLRKHLLYE